MEHRRKLKREKPEEEEENVEEQEEEEVKEKPIVKRKPVAKLVPQEEKEEEEEDFIELDNRRRIQVKEFKGKLYVDIREYYSAGIEMKPTKKGVFLPVDSWKKLISLGPTVDSKIASYGKKK